MALYLKYTKYIKIIENSKKKCNNYFSRKSI